MAIDFDQARYAMIEQQVRPWEVLDPRVLETLSAIKREDYVPARHRKLAFADVALPLEHGEFMMKPVVEGRMLQALDIAPEHDVLEVGTGSGFITACLARLARAVTSIDIHADFVERARQRLHADGIANVWLETADALEYAPVRQFDAVCITGAVAEIPSRFLAWVKPEGRLFVVRGHSPVQEAVRLVRHGDRWSEQSLFETDIPYLRGAAPVERFTL